MNCTAMKSMYIAARTGAAGLSLCLMLSACAPNDQDVQRELQSAVLQVKGSIPSLPVLKPYTATQYKLQDMADPFGPAKAQLAGRLEGKKDVGRPDQGRPRQPLEAFALESMELNGTIIERGVVNALISFHDNLYTVKKGEYMGQNYGRIMKITDTEVILLESVQEATGEWTERENRLAVGVVGKSSP